MLTVQYVVSLSYVVQVNTFQAATKRSITDQRLFQRATIEEKQAWKWRSVKLPHALLEPTKVVGRELGYDFLPELPNECTWLKRPAQAAPEVAQNPVVCLHGIWGSLLQYEAMAPRLRFATEGVIGIALSKRLVSDCEGWEELMSRYLQLVQRLCPSEGPIQLLAYSFGCRIAHGLAPHLERCGHAVRLVLLDGPIGGPLGPLEEAVLEQGQSQSEPSLPVKLVRLVANGGLAMPACHQSRMIKVLLFVASSDHVATALCSSTLPHVRQTVFDKPHASFMTECAEDVASVICDVADVVDS